MPGRIGSRHWEHLSNTMKGDLVLPGDAAYETVRRSFYTEFDSIFPRAVAFCEDPADVANCVAFCHEHDLEIAMRSGGHSMGGYSSSIGLVLDTSRITSVEPHLGSRPDTSRLVIGSGSRQVHTLVQASKSGLAVLQGGFPTVGAAGFFSGGGFGAESRIHGMACDRITGADIVLANGELVHCSEKNHPDLFWAVRGAGGGNFGVITHFEVLPHTPRTFTTFSMTWSWESALAVTVAWQRLMLESSRNLGGQLTIQLDDSDVNSLPAVVVSGSWHANPEELGDQLAPFIAEVGSAPTSESATTLPYAESFLRDYGASDHELDQLEWFDNAHQATPRQQHFIDRNRLFSEALPETAVSELLAAFESNHRPGQTRFLSFCALGGKINDLERGDTAYVHRDSAFFVGISVETKPPGDGAYGRSELESESESWANSGFAILDNHSNRESYQNFIDTRLDDWKEAYYAENYTRLSDVKRRYDPDGFFRFRQGIV